MPIATTPILERIARVLAGVHLHDSAEIAERQASLAIDRHWPDHVTTALAILRAMRDPDEEMARAGQIDVWQDMIAVALREAELNPTSFP